MLTKQDALALNSYIRATNYLTVAQIFLKDNFLLSRPLVSDDIKPRLLGHWGSCPGVNVIYAHLSLINKKRKNKDNLFILGPGHAFPALQANLFLEESLRRVDSKASLNESGIAYVSHNFSWPYGFPSHASPYSPGVILEGGELGYSLSSAYGAVLDNPDMIATCLIGDGEAETGALSASWQLNKVVAQPQNGFVLPILHLNGYKISGPTIFGRMSDKELVDYFRGLRYEPFLVDYVGQKKDELLHQTLNQAFDKIDAIKAGLASDNRLPVIIFRSPKGLSGVKELKGEKIEGNYLAHQVVLDEARTDSYQMARLEQWLKSYKFNELFADGRFGEWRDQILPEFDHRFGNSKHALGKNREGLVEKLELPKLADFAEPMLEIGESKSQSLHKVGAYVREVFKLNQKAKNFRFFSPDETSSNKLSAIYDETSRAWNMESKPWDTSMSPDGRSMDILSEQSLEGMMQGYTLTGRYAMLTSYESFAPIISSMVDQHAKFLDQSRHTSFRGKVPSLNFLLTSNGWRQDHNGFSHQNPSFIDGLLRRQGEISNVFFPSCDNASLVATSLALQSYSQINAIVAGKTLEPRWRSMVESRKDIEKGANIWDFVSDDLPELVFSACGDYVLKETLFAMKIVKKELPSARLRMSYISVLSSGAIGLSNNKLTQSQFDDIFTAEKPVIINFHGYPESLKAILFNYGNSSRFSVHGYIEKGSTTTPFDMMVRNQTSRWHLAIEAFAKFAEMGRVDIALADTLIDKYRKKLLEHSDYIKENGTDLPEIVEQTWS